MLHFSRLKNLLKENKFKSKKVNVLPKFIKKTAKFHLVLFEEKK